MVEEINDLVAFLNTSLLNVSQQGFRQEAVIYGHETAFVVEVTGAIDSPSVMSPYMVMAHVYTVKTRGVKCCSLGSGG